MSAKARRVRVSRSTSKSTYRAGARDLVEGHVDGAREGGTEDQEQRGRNEQVGLIAIERKASKEDCGRGKTNHRNPHRSVAKHQMQRGVFRDAHDRLCPGGTSS